MPAPPISVSLPPSPSMVVVAAAAIQLVGVTVAVDCVVEGIAGAADGVAAELAGSRNWRQARNSPRSSPTVSMPWLAASLTLSATLSTKYRSSPLPPVMTSLPMSPNRRSLPSPPVKVSLPTSPLRMLSPALPMRRLLNSLPDALMASAPVKSQSLDLLVCRQLEADGRLDRILAAIVLLDHLVAWHRRRCRCRCPARRSARRRRLSPSSVSLPLPPSSTLLSLLPVILLERSLPVPLSAVPPNVEVLDGLEGRRG